MSQLAVEHYLGRLLTDEQFRRIAGKSLVTACRGIGLELTAGELDLLSRVDLNRIEDCSRHLDSRLRRAESRLEL